MKLILSEYIFEGQNELSMQCRNLQEMYEEIQKIDSSIAEKLFDESGKIKRNIILVMNDKIVNKSTYSEVEFLDNTVLEVFFQFAGG